MKDKVVRRINKTDNTRDSRLYRFKEEETKMQDEKQRSASDSSKPSRPMYQQHEDHPTTIFWVAVGVSQAIGLACIGLIIYWAKLYGGFAWASSPNHMFFYHPLLMILGLVFFYGDAIIVYRALSFLPKPILKIIHASLHIGAIVFSIVGLVAVLEYHRLTYRPDFYSLHSWIGIATFAFFCLQYISGFVVFLYPGLPPNWRSRIMPFHTFFGTGLFVMAIAACETGLTEKLIWTPGYTQASFNTQAVIGNTLGALMIIFAFLIVFITTHAAYKRRPLPNELPPTSLN